MNRALFAGLAPALCISLGGVASARTTVERASLPAMPRHLAPRCEVLARPPASARSDGPALAARVSVASCQAEAAMSEVAVRPDAASVHRLGDAAAPSLALLDGVIRIGNPYWQVIAQDAKRDIFTGMIVRERAAVPGADPVAHAALEPMLAPWHADAFRAEEAIARLAAADPRLARTDPVIGRAIATATGDTSARARHDAAAIDRLDQRIAFDKFLRDAFWASDSRTPLSRAWHDQHVAERQRRRLESDLASERATAASRPTPRSAAR